MSSLSSPRYWTEDIPEGHPKVSSSREAASYLELPILDPAAPKN